MSKAIFESVTYFVRQGGTGKDTLIGGLGSDWIRGGAGNDTIIDLLGDNLFDAGSGNDCVTGGLGKDRFIHRFRENIGATDRYDGGLGTDTLRLELTAADWARTDVQADIAAFLVHLGTAKNKLLGLVGLTTDFQFKSTNLHVSNIEKLEVMVDGVAFDLADAAVTARGETLIVNSAGTKSVDLLANDTASDRVASISFTTLPGSAYGSIAVAPSLAGSIQTAMLTFTSGAGYAALKAGETKTETFSYTVKDVDGDTGTATATIQIVGVNDGPVAVADFATTNEDTLFTFNALANDTDVDGDPLKAVAASTPAGKGRVSVVDNKLVFDPGPDFQRLKQGQSETVELNYTIKDPFGAEATSNVTVTVVGVNDGPVAVADNATIDEDTAVIIDVLTNDTDVDQDLLNIVAASAPAGKGRVSVVDNKLVFDPGLDFQKLKQGQSETVELIYRINDVNNAEATSHVTLIVKGLNDGPVGSATAIFPEGLEDVQYLISVVDLLSGFSDKDDDVLAVVSLTASHGEVVNNGNGTFTIVPEANYNGIVTLNYIVIDTNGASVAASQSFNLAAVEEASSVGYVIDGYIEDATVFTDTNRNGMLDDGEARATTDAFGRFVLEGGSGPLIAFGGIDVATNQALLGQLTAPANAAVITPLTTLIMAIVDDPATDFSVAEAEAKILAAFSIDESTDLLQLDPVTSAFQGESGAYVAGVSVLNTVSMIAAGISGAQGQNELVAAQVIAALAAEIAALPSGVALDLADAGIVRSIAGEASTTPPDPAVLDGLVAIVTQSNQALNDAAATSGNNVALVETITALAIVAQGSASDALLTADSSTITAIADAYSGSNLLQAVAEAKTELGAIAPAVQTTATLTSLADLIPAASTNIRVDATSSTLTPDDQLEGGGGYDVLSLFGPGSFDLATVSTFSGFEEVRLNYVNSAGPTELRLSEGIDLNVSVSGSMFSPVQIYLSTGATRLDLDGLSQGEYFLSSGTAIIDGADFSARGSSGHIYHFSTGAATVTDANAKSNTYILSSGTATIFAGGVSDRTGGANIYYLADGSYTLHGADNNGDIFVFSDVSQVRSDTVIDGGTSTVVGDTVELGGAGQRYDLAAVRAIVSNIESYSIGSEAVLQVDDASLVGVFNISGGGTLTTQAAALDLSNKSIGTRVESLNTTGTTFTVTDRTTAFAIQGGAGSDTLLGQGITLSEQDRSTIFLQSSIETIIDDSGTFTRSVQLTPQADVIASLPEDLTDITVDATSSTLTPDDQLEGGGGYDVLSLFGPGSFDLATVSTFSGFEEVRLNYVNSAGPTELRLSEGIDLNVSVSGSMFSPVQIYLSTGATRLDLDGLSQGEYFLSSGTAIIDGADFSARGSSGHIYHFSTGAATVTDANAKSNTYILSSGTATIFAGGVSDRTGGANIYYLADGSYTLHGADNNGDIFVFSDVSQVRSDTVIDGGTSTVVGDTVELGGAGQRYDLAAVRAIVSNIESYSIGSEAVLQVDDASLVGVFNISGGGTLTTQAAALDLSNKSIGTRVESLNTTGTTFTVTDRTTAFAIQGGAGSDTLLGQGITLSEQDRSTIFLQSSIETIIDDSGTFTRSVQLTPQADVIASLPEDLTDITVDATSSTLTPDDQLEGGGGYDVLSLFGPGSFDLATVSTFSGFEEVRLNYVNSAGPTELRLSEGIDLNVSVSGSMFSPVQIYLSTGATRLDLDGLSQGEYFLSSGTAIIDGADFSARGSSGHIYHFSTGAATVTDANAKSNTYILSSGTATIFAGGVSDRTGGANIYYLADGSYTLHGADNNGDIFVFSDVSQVRSDTVIDGGTSTVVGDTVELGGAGQRYDLAAVRAIVSNIESYSIGSEAVLQVDDASLVGVFNISGGGTLTTQAAALDLSNKSIGTRVESLNTTGTTFTVTDRTTAFAIQGGAGSDTLLGQGITLSEQDRSSIFLFSSVEIIQDQIGSFGNDAANILTARFAGELLTGQGGADTFVFQSGFGSAAIADFTPGQDVIELSQALFQSGSILDYATQVNADVVINDDAGNALRLLNFVVANISASDFNLI